MHRSCRGSSQGATTLRRVLPKPPYNAHALSPEERRKVYVILNLTVEPLADGGLKINGAFGEEPVWEDARTSTR
jgi:hypothetical protein